MKTSLKFTLLSTMSAALLLAPTISFAYIFIDPEGCAPYTVTQTGSTANGATYEFGGGCDPAAIATGGTGNAGTPIRLLSLPAMPVQIKNRVNGNVVAKPTVDAGGRFSAKGLQPGNYDVSIDDRRALLYLVKADGTLNGTVRLAPKTKAAMDRIRMLDPKGS